MRRIYKKVVALILTALIIFNLSSVQSQAVFNDLSRRGVSFNLSKGNWTVFYTKLPGSNKLVKLYAKVTKFRRSEFPVSTGMRSSTTPSTVTVVLTVQVQLPKLLSKTTAKKLLNAGHDYIDYVDLIVVDKRSGENLNTSETSEEGMNYHNVNVTESEWKGFKPQKLSWSNGVTYQYYVSYAKTVIIKFPSNYTKTCVGVCGTHINNYDKMIDWNEGFTQGYTVLSDTTHVKANDKKMTKKLCHVMNIK
ncbi:MAG: hypothetical protein E7302_08210 [Butyrivibrio sp.]|nr:hypothetical protein [Butyrivibrio sp.]